MLGIEKVQQAVCELDIESIQEIVHFCLNQGIDALTVIEKGIAPGLEIVGEKFEAGEYFLGELILAGKTASDAMKILEPHLPKDEASRKGKVVMATVHGDLHEIGKDIVTMLLQANGFEVIDLGVDVPTHKILHTLEETGAKLLGLSLLLSTAVGSLQETVDAIQRSPACQHVKIIIGGACASENLKLELGVDGYGENALAAVALFNQWTIV
jgi:methanogenic corrinoid protein MtbC1